MTNCTPAPWFSMTVRHAWLWSPLTVAWCLARYLDAAKKLVQQHTGLPIENMLMSATHTHTAGTATPVFQSEADAEYQLFLTRKIADAVRLALNNLEPARVGWGVGKLCPSMSSTAAGK